MKFWMATVAPFLPMGKRAQAKLLRWKESGPLATNILGKMTPSLALFPEP